MREIAYNLRKLRKERRLTQEQLAKILYVNPAAICKFEKGTSFPKIDFLLEIAKYFGVTINEILGNEEVMLLQNRKFEISNEMMHERVLLDGKHLTDIELLLCISNVRSYREMKEKET
jgi:hypothetical protein